MGAIKHHRNYPHITHKPQRVQKNMRCLTVSSLFSSTRAPKIKLSVRIFPNVNYSLAHCVLFCGFFVFLLCAEFVGRTFLI
jgi:hypothetical protein